MIFFLFLRRSFNERLSLKLILIGKKMCALLNQFIVPLLSETADKGLAEVLVQRHAAFPTLDHSTAAHIPAVVVDGLKLAIFVDAEGVEMATDRFLPVYLAVAVGLFYGTEGSAVLSPGHIGTFAVVDQGGAGLGGVVEGRDSVAMNYFDAGFGHVGLNGGEYALEDGDFFF